jgi:hypothetical protein
MVDQGSRVTVSSDSLTCQEIHTHLSRISAVRRMAVELMATTLRRDTIAKTNCKTGHRGILVELVTRNCGREPLGSCDDVDQRLR